jgi:hypothetical protein
MSYPTIEASPRKRPVPERFEEHGPRSVHFHVVSQALKYSGAIYAGLIYTYRHMGPTVGMIRAGKHN